MSNAVSSDIIARLVECGMEEKHAQIVMDLATHPPSKASDVGKRIGISRMDAYNSLRKMQDLGFVKATLDKPMRFLGLKIQEVFGLLIQKSKMDLRRMQEHLDAMKSDAHNVLLSHDNEYHEPNFTVLKDRHSIMANLQSILSEAEHSVWMLLGDWGIFHLRRSGAFEALQDAVNRGIDVKISTSLNDKTIKFFDDLDTRIEIRHHEEFRMQGVYVDDEVGLQFINVEKNPTGRGKTDSALLIESKAFMEAQSQLMAIQWGAGTSYRAAKARLTEGRIIEPLNLSLGEGSYYERLRSSVNEQLAIQNDQPNTILRREGEPIAIDGNVSAEALQNLGVDLDEVLLGVGIRIGEELASKWDNVQDDNEFWKHLSHEWNQLGMGQILTNGMPPNSLTVLNGGACGGNPTSNSMLCHLDEGVLKGILKTRHDFVILSTQRVCTNDGSNSCHFKIDSEKETLEPSL